MSDVQLGTFPPLGAERDAIHVAVIPVVAHKNLSPGDAVGYCAGRTDDDNHIGVIDPFLTEIVVGGQRVWLVLYPNSVCGMRHHWSHPSFPDETNTSELAVAGDKTASETWLKDYVRKHCPYWESNPDGGYSEFLSYVKNDRWIYYYGSDCHGLGDVDDADELFRHLSVVLDRRINASYFEAFTCTC